MTSPIGHKRSAKSDFGRAGFTLIELILVMAMLLTVLGVASSSLRNFFRGRDLDSEARRFLSLTRYGQSRAVSEGIPMVLWIDSQERTYGLEAQAGYLDLDDKAVEFTFAEKVEVDVQLPLLAAVTRTSQPVIPGLGNLPMIRFLPDGFIAETSPDGITFYQDDDTEIWITLNSNRLNYAIQPDHAPTTRR